MKRNLQLLLVFFGIILCHNLNAQENKPAPYLKFTTPRIIDLGEIPNDSLIVIDIKFKNTGNAPLIINDVVKSCTCTSSKIDKEAYDPGKEGVITMTIDTKGKIGKNVMTASIYANTQQQEYVVRVSMDIVKKAVSLPDNKKKYSVDRSGPQRYDSGKKTKRGGFENNDIEAVGISEDNYLGMAA